MSQQCFKEPSDNCKKPHQYDESKWYPDIDDDEDCLPVITVNGNCTSDNQKSCRISENLLKQHMQYVYKLEKEGKQIPYDCYDCLQKVKNPEEAQHIRSTTSVDENKTVENKESKNKQAMSFFFDLSDYEPFFEVGESDSSSYSVEKKKVSEQNCSKFSDSDFKSIIDKTDLCDEHKTFLKKIAEKLKNVKCKKGCNICFCVKNNKKKKHKHVKGKISQELEQNSERECDVQNLEPSLCVVDFKINNINSDNQYKKKSEKTLAEEFKGDENQQECLCNEAANLQNCQCKKEATLVLLEKNEKKLQDLEERMSSYMDNLVGQKYSAQSQNRDSFVEKESQQFDPVNEEIMRNRQIVWGNNIPPDFIVKGTTYAKKHADCCTNNFDNVNKQQSYICPKNAKDIHSNEFIKQVCNFEYKNIQDDRDKSSPKFHQNIKHKYPEFDVRNSERRVDKCISSQKCDSESKIISPRKSSVVIKGDKLSDKDSNSNQGCKSIEPKKSIFNTNVDKSPSLNKGMLCENVSSSIRKNISSCSNAFMDWSGKKEKQFQIFDEKDQKPQVNQSQQTDSMFRLLSNRLNLSDKDGRNEIPNILKENKSEEKACKDTHKCDESDDSWGEDDDDDDDDDEHSNNCVNCCTQCR